MGWGNMPEGVCPKCGWKAPAGLLKCPFCKTYIRTPGASSSSSDLKLRKQVAEEKEAGPPPIDPNLPKPDPTVVKRVQREIARELFDDSDKWEVFERDKEAPIVSDS